MLYRILRPFIYFSLKAYFRRIQVIGEENLPANGPVLFVANHPSALLDPLVVATLIKQPLHFVAAAEYFGKKLTAWFLRKQFNMIPVYRPALYPDRKTSNDAMFLHCHECLKDGGSLLIFPEGNSMTEKRLRPLKTGTARIALGYQRFAETNDQVPIVPIGLNYTNPHQFQGSLIVSIGAPVTFQPVDGPEQMEDEPVVRALTAKIQKSLENQVLHIPDQSLDSLVTKTERVFSNWLMQHFQISKEETKRKFRLQRDIVEAIGAFTQSDVQAVLHMENKIDEYLRQMATLNLRHSSFDYRSRLTWSFLILRILVTSPLFLAAFLINCIPYFTSRIIFRRVFLPKMGNEKDEGDIHPVFAGSISFSIGTALFLTWYMVIALATGILYHPWAGVALFPLSYFLGQFALRYLGWCIQSFRVFRFWMANRHQHQKIQRLDEMRQNLFAEMENYVKTFTKNKASI
ncbi:MAG: lysophospholipid acyltransferase family protein [Cyclobacteriaceae bacterium]|nr:lysophospholipid acyltransferase family protein [Cyclobacteriaceae bacterium]